MRLRAIAAVAAVALCAAAPAGADYDELENWRNSYGRTVDHLTGTDARWASEFLIALDRSVRLLGELERVPDRSAQQLGAWPWSGDVERGGYDRMGNWTGTKIELEFPNRDGRMLAATLWGPSEEMLAATGLDTPLPGIVYSGGIVSSQPMYYWFAQEMARAGYVVMTYDVSGQGRSEGNSTGNAPNDLRDALDFFVSPANPLRDVLDIERIGTAGHSMGASAVQTVADHCGLVRATSAMSDLRASYLPGGATPAGACGPRAPIPIQGQGADYETFIFPTQPTFDSDPDDKLTGFGAVAGAGLDVQEVVIESGSHMAWSHVTGAYTASWSEEVALHYALAWFDRYLHGDLARGGATGTERLTAVYAADADGHGVSKKYRSAYDLDDRADADPATRLRCGDMVAGC